MTNSSIGRVEIFGIPLKVMESQNKLMCEVTYFARQSNVDVIVVEPNGTISEPKIISTCFDKQSREILAFIADKFLEIIMTNPIFNARLLQYTTCSMFKAVEGQSIQKLPVPPIVADGNERNDALFIE